MREFDKLYLQYMAQGELDVQNNRLTAQEEVFDSLRAFLLAKYAEPMGVNYNNSDRQEQ